MTIVVISDDELSVPVIVFELRPSREIFDMLKVILGRSSNLSAVLEQESTRLVTFFDTGTYSVNCVSISVNYRIHRVKPKLVYQI